MAKDIPIDGGVPIDGVVIEEKVDALAVKDSEQFVIASKTDGKSIPEIVLSLHEVRVDDGRTVMSVGYECGDGVEVHMHRVRSAKG